MKRTFIIVALSLSGYLLTACGSNSSSSVSELSNNSTTSQEVTNSNESSMSSQSSNEEESATVEFAVEDVIAELDTADMFTNNELTLTYDEASATAITLSDESVTITEEGTYIISGTLTDGQIIVEVSDSEKVHLILDGVEINSNSSAALYIKDGDKVFITLADDSYNTFSSSGEYINTDDNNVDGAIFAKCDLAFMGTGTLEITSAYGHGIVGKDDVVFTGGTYNITASSHGISANDSIRIADGTFTIDSGKDGMQCDNDEDCTKGFVYIAGGTYSIKAEQDGISSTSMLQIDGGDFEIYSGGGFVEVLNEITMGEGSGNMSQTTDSLEYSMKALKAVNILINDGIINLSAYEDAMHADYNLTFNGGTVLILSGDDAVHADTTLAIYDVNLEIVESYEGLEGYYIYIYGGNLIINAYDDAVNATDSNGCLTITGGNVTLSCVGDGLDSNGDFVMEGGTVIIDCNPIYSGGDGDVDVSGEITYTGGTITDTDGNEIDPTAGLSSSGGSFPGSSNQRTFSNSQNRR